MSELNDDRPVRGRIMPVVFFEVAVDLAHRDHTPDTPLDPERFHYLFRAVRLLYVDGSLDDIEGIHPDQKGQFLELTVSDSSGLLTDAWIRAMEEGRDRRHELRMYEEGC